MLAALLLPCSSGNAQTFQWTKQLGSANGEFPRSVGLDANGNIYIAGFF